MTKASEIKGILKSIASPKWESGSGNLFFTAEVKKVDDETCDVEVGDFTLEGVHLAAASDGNANNFIVKPKVGSIVLVCDKTGGSLAWVNVVAFSEIAKVTWVIDEDVELEVKGDVKLKCDGNIELNGANNKGLVKVKELTDKINAVEDKVNNILSTLKGVSVALAPSGTYPFAPIFSAINPLVKTQQTEIENDKIKH